MISLFHRLSNCVLGEGRVDEGTFRPSLALSGPPCSTSKMFVTISFASVPAFSCGCRAKESPLSQFAS